MSTPAQAILSPLSVDNATKADAWEAFNSAKNETDLQVKLQAIKGLPQTAMADLWEAKKSSGGSPEQQAISQLPNANAQAAAYGARPLTAQPPQTVTPKSGESFDQTMNRGVQAGKQILADPNKLRMANVQAEGEAVNKAPIVLAAAGLPGMLAAPGAAVGSLAAGTAAGYLGKKGAQAAGASPATVENVSGAAGLLGAIGGGVGGAKLQGMIPSAVRAVQNLNEVSAAVGSHTIDVAGPGNAALRARQIADSGGGNVKVINDFLKRASDPNKSPMTYDEGRDFYQNASKLSASEKMDTKGSMKAAVAQFASELGKSLNETADRGGRAAQLQQGLKEYSQSKQIQGAVSSVGDAVKKNAISSLVKGGLTVAGGAGAYETLKKLGIIP